MTFIRRLFGGEPKAETWSPLDDRWYGPDSGGASAAGVRITPDVAMKLSAVWRCVSIVCGSVAMLPLPVYKRISDTERQRDSSHPLYFLLHDRPNAFQTSFEWRHMMQQHLLLRGNAYSRIIPGPRGAVDQLVPMHPDAVTPEQQNDGTVKYRVRMKAGRTETLFDDEVFHLIGLSDDGVTGMSVIDYARESMGLGIAQEQFGARFFSQSATPPIMLKHPGKLSVPALERLKASWQEAYGGLRNVHKPAILEEGLDAKSMDIGLTAEQAQLVSAREFTTSDIARWFGVPNHMIGETTGETSWGTGIEQMGIGYVTYTLLPWLKRWEQRISHSLILVTSLYYAEFGLDMLLRGDAKSRAEALQILRINGIINADEWRAVENMNAIPDGSGQARWRPANYIEIGGPADGAAPDMGFGASLDRRVLEAAAAQRNGNGVH